MILCVYIYNPKPETGGSSRKSSRHLRRAVVVVWEGSGYPDGPQVVPFWASYLEFYKVIPKRNYFGAYGYWIQGHTYDNLA